MSTSKISLNITEAKGNHVDFRYTADASGKGQTDPGIDLTTYSNFVQVTVYASTYVLNWLRVLNRYENGFVEVGAAQNASILTEQHYKQTGVYNLDDATVCAGDFQTASKCSSNVLNSVNQALMWLSWQAYLTSCTDPGNFANRVQALYKYIAISNLTEQIPLPVEPPK